MPLTAVAAAPIEQSARTWQVAAMRNESITLAKFRPAHTGPSAAPSSFPAA